MNTTPDEQLLQPDKTSEEADNPVTERRRREPILNLPGSITALMAICVGVHVLRVVIFDGSIDRWAILNFAFFPARYDPAFIQFDLPTLVSPLTHTFLHGDWTHLGFNMIWLAAFAAPVARRIGTLRSFGFWAFTALGAVLLHAVIYLGDPVPLLGASGAVSGFLGAAARFGFRAVPTANGRGFGGPLLPPLKALRQRGVLPFLVIWMVLNWATGADLFGLAQGASIAWEAHIGGLVTGFLAIGLFDRQPAVATSAA